MTKGIACDLAQGVVPPFRNVLHQIRLQPRPVFKGCRTAHEPAPAARRLAGCRSNSLTHDNYYFYQFLFLFDKQRFNVIATQGFVNFACHLWSRERSFRRTLVRHGFLR